MKKTEEEMDTIIDKCNEQIIKDKSRWPGMTYEQGVVAALEWAIGHIDDDLMEEF